MKGEAASLPSDLLVSGELLKSGQRVAILDAGAQYVDLIQRACFRQGYAADILPLDTPFAAIEDHYGAFFVSGGPANSHLENAPMPDPGLWQTKKGVMGICYGQHAMAMALGGCVEPGAQRQDGAIKTKVDTKHPLFGRIKQDITALFTHGDFVTQLPEGFQTIGQHQLSNGQNVISAMAKDNFAAVQFHPEVFDDTPFGYDIFKGFLQDMCGLQPDEEMLRQLTALEVQKRKAFIAEKVGDRDLIAFLSGGVDSTVAVRLASEVIAPEKLHVYYIDMGFMRDEDDMVIEEMQALGINVHKIDAVETFEQATITFEDGTISPPLIEVTDPKVKRKIIGKRFAEYKDDIAASLGLDTTQVMLLQGTNAADRIESGFSLSGAQDTEEIKEHHNQVKEIKDLEAAGLLVEPLNDIHKDEIRRIGEYLGLPDEVVWRHPFPGPGDAIRILGYRKGEYEMPAAELQAAMQDYLNEQGLGQFTSLLLPTRSVGVGGDARTYVLPAAIQGPQAWPELEWLAQEIPGHFRGHVNRVVYALGNQTLTLSNLSLTERALGRPERAQLRWANRIVFEQIRKWQLMKRLGQFPVISLPLAFGEVGSKSIVLRPVLTSTFMTAKAFIPGKDIDPDFAYETSTRLLSEVPDISQVLWEITGKPPGTIEWE